MSDRRLSPRRFLAASRRYSVVIARGFLPRLPMRRGAYHVAYVDISDNFLLSACLWVILNRLRPVRSSQILRPALQ